jgi:hypothetical protein
VTRLVFALGLLLALGLWPGRALADEILVLSTVDDVSRDKQSDDKLVVTGIPVGADAPRTIPLRFWVTGRSSLLVIAESCERYALLMMSKPGRYLLELTAADFSAGSGPSDYNLARNCRLKRAP